MKRKGDRPNIVRRALESRTRLAEHLNDRSYQEGVVRKYMRDMNGTYHGTGLLTDKWRLSLQVGEVYAISDEMFHVIEAAGDDLPDEYVAEHWHLHAEHGFVWLPQDITEGPDLDNGDWPPVSFATWHHGTGWTYRKGGVEGMAAPGIEINYWWKVPARDLIVPVGSDFLPYGLTALGVRSHGYEDGSEKLVQEDRLSRATKFILALQLIMRQELPTMARWQVPKAEMRTMRRLSLPTNPVTVIDLRRRKYMEHPDADGEGGRHLRQRHIVRGHWHGYWVGPGHMQHPGGTEDKVLIYNYVLPYVKGPEGAPLKVVSDRVHVVRR